MQRDPFVRFIDALDAVAGIARIPIRGRNEMTDFVGPRSRRTKGVCRKLYSLPDVKFMHSTVFR